MATIHSNLTARLRLLLVRSTLNVLHLVGGRAMSAFRRLIMGAAQFSMVVMIVGLTIAGGLISVASKATTVLFMEAYGITVQDESKIAVLSFVFGAVSGFFTAASIAAVLFTLVEIAQNTRATLEMLQGRKPLS
jgi:hypothetical protein